VQIEFSDTPNKETRFVEKINVLIFVLTKQNKMKFSTLQVRQNTYTNFENQQSKDLCYMGGKTHSELLQAEFSKWFDHYKKAGFKLLNEFSGSVMRSAMFVKHDQSTKISEYIYIDYDGFNW